MTSNPIRFNWRLTEQPSEVTCTDSRHRSHPHTPGRFLSSLRELRDRRLTEVCGVSLVKSRNNEIVTLCGTTMEIYSWWCGGAEGAAKGGGG